MEVLLYLTAFGAVAVLMPAVLRLSRVLGAVDIPDGERKLHAAPTSRLGGLAIFAVFFFGALRSPSLLDARAAALLSGGTVLFAAGLADDVHSLPAPLKLLLQSGAAACALLTVGTPSSLILLGRHVSLSAPLSFGLCLLLAVGMINACNFIDGLDAEAASVMSVGFVALALVLHSRGDDGGRVLCLLLVFCLFAFLLYNRPPAVVFMGDEGSQLLGLAAAVLLLPAEGEALSLSPLWLFAVPLFDLVTCAVRRLAHGKNPFRADRGHIHHRLLRRGFSPSAAVGILTLFAACGALIGYGMSAA